MVYVTRRVEFCASHRLYNPGFSEEQNNAIYGRCNNPNGHGHNYTLEVTVRGAVDPQTGMVMDLKRLAGLLKTEIIDRVDHMNMNVDVDFMSGVIPTAENIVVSFWQILQAKLPEGCGLYEIRLWESDRNIAFYRGEGAEITRHPAG